MALWRSCCRVFPRGLRPLGSSLGFCLLGRVATSWSGCAWNCQLFRDGGSSSAVPRSVFRVSCVTSTCICLVVALGGCNLEGVRNRRQKKKLLAKSSQLRVSITTRSSILCRSRGILQLIAISILLINIAPSSDHMLKIRRFAHHFYDIDWPCRFHHG